MTPSKLAPGIGISLLTVAPVAITTASKSFPADPASKQDILWRDSDTLGVKSTQVAVFEEADNVRL